MRIRTLFSVPDGEKVTEKALRRVLISSICAILLCMTCLVSTTWAWFAVSIENEGNVIQIGKPEIRLKVDNSDYTPGEELTAGTHTVSMEHANEADDLAKKSTLYVTLTVHCGGDTITVYTTLDQENQYKAEIQLDNQTENACKFGWEVSWFAPANANELTAATISLTAEDPTQPSTEATTEPSGDPATDNTQEPSTVPSTEAAKEPSAGNETDPDAGDSEEDSTEATTEPSDEPSTAPSTETTPESTEAEAANESTEAANEATEAETA